MTGLTNNTAYTFAVAAENAANIFSPDSAQTALVTPTSPPPTGVSASAGNNSATVSWTAPALAGVDDYRVTPLIGGVAQAPIDTTSTATSFLVTGLANGTAYTFAVAAHYPTGFTTESAQSAPVTPSAAGVAQQITVAIPAGTLTHHRSRHDRRSGHRRARLDGQVLAGLRQHQRGHGDRHPVQRAGLDGERTGFGLQLGLQHLPGQRPGLGPVRRDGLTLVRS